MTATPSAISRLGHPAFRDLSPEGLSALDAESQLVRFRTGQLLSEAEFIANTVFLILEGEARLLTPAPQKVATLAKLGPGTLVGLASLLRAAACEHVAASCELVAATLPDSLILKLYQQEAGFRAWCDSNLFPSELAALLNQLLDASNRSDLNLAGVLAAAAPHAILVAPTAAALAELASDRCLLLASGNAEGVPFGTALQPSQPLPTARPPFPLRLVSCPQTLLEQVAQRPETINAASTQPQGVNDETAPAPELPQRSALEWGHLPERPALELLRAKEPQEATLACLQMLARQMNLPYRRDAVEKVLRDAIQRGQKPSLQLLGQLSANMGLHVLGSRVPALMAGRLQTPALIAWGESFALVTASNQKGLSLASPLEGELLYTAEQIHNDHPDGLDVLLIDRTAATPSQRFGVSWFWPALKRYRGILTQVLVASFVVQLFTLANPLLVQVIIDKVITQRSLDTLQILGIALVVVALLEGVIGSVRTFLFAETTNRIDLRLGAEVIDHLLRLPLGYFDRRPVGELGSRISELEKIRNFLTGQALTTVLDAAFSVIYIVVMALYSWVLTIVALAVLPIQVGLTLLGAPLFRRQFRAAAEANASTQSHLVEVLTGIQTVKAQNVEMVSRWTWQERYAQYIGKTFEKTITGTAINESSQVLQKISQLLVLWVGARMVLQGSLTLGQLIAFRILSGYVTQPLLRLSSIWQTVQELRVSFERLADVVDTPQESTEADQRKLPLPPIQGHVRFEKLTFSFGGAGTPAVLRQVDLDVPTGTFVGIVGQSGSGKSTLMKLLPRLYSPQKGRILIDDYDIDKVELYSLRRQIGIVPQDPLLFSGSVADNIALTNPECSSEAIERAARIACAHEFIMQLPAGYSTMVGERGAGLSGGQRQRIAIARTLLSNPKLLVMDEATSALDYDTERRVCNNLRDTLRGCTVFFITHRLSTIRGADRIVLMDQGAIVEQGSHEALMAQRGRYYALSRQQDAGVAA